MKKLYMILTPLAILLIIFIMFDNVNHPVVEINNLNNNIIGVLGHRGMSQGSEYPGNSIEAIETALNFGADGAEIDVQITRDNILVIFHDKELIKKTNCQGRMRDYSWAEIDNCIYNKSVERNINVITVDSLFNRIPNCQDYYFSFDCKFTPGDEESKTDYYRDFVIAIKQVIDKHNMQNKVLIEAGSSQFHKLLIQNEVQALQFITGKDMSKQIKIAEELDLYGIGIGSRVTGKDIIKAHEKGFRVMTWIPKTKWANVKAVKKNPDFIQTADLVHLLQLFGKYKQQ